MVINDVLWVQKRRLTPNEPKLLVRSFEQRPSSKLVLIQYYSAAWPHCPGARILKISTLLGQAVEERPN
jgi:hypothetical protein